MQTIQRVAVLGAGTMGSRIAAHFANAGIASVLLDLTKEVGAERRRDCHQAAPRRVLCRRLGVHDHHRQLRRRSRQSRRRATGSSKPSPKTWRSSARSGARWKRCASRDSIVSTNTSGIPLRHISEGFSPELPQAFSRHAFFQSAALSASARSDPRPGNRSRDSRIRLGVRRPPSGQGRGAVQGYAELHRQPHRQLFRRHHRENHGRGRLHRRRSGRASPDR